MFKINKVITLLFLIPYLGFSNQIDKSIEVIGDTNDKLKSYQKKIDKLDEKSKILLEDYKYTNKELQNTIKYNNQLKEITNSQDKEISNLNKQISEIDQTHKNVYPLMSDMIKSLDKLIEADTPFFT